MPAKILQAQTHMQYPCFLQVIKAGVNDDLIPPTRPPPLLHMLWPNPNAGYNLTKANYRPLSRALRVCSAQNCLSIACLLATAH